MLVGGPRAAAAGSFGLPEGSFSTVLLSHSPTHRHGLARTALPPQAHLLTSWRLCFALCNFLRCAQNDVLHAGGEGLRSPPPARSGKAPAVTAAAFLPPLVKRTSKALLTGAGLPASSSSGRGGGRAGEHASGVGRGKGARPGRRDRVSQLLNIPDATGDTQAIVAAVVGLYDDPATRLRQCRQGVERRLLPLKRARRPEAAEAHVCGDVCG